MITRQDSRPIAENAEGCFLTFDCQNQGALFQIWSKKAVPEALMYYKPKTPPPAFRFNNGGKTELIRNIQSDHKKYFQGWCAFLKMAKKDGGEVTMITNNEPVKAVAVVLHLKNLNVLKMEFGKAYNIADVDSVAVIPAESRALDAKTLTCALFKEKADSAGAGISFA